jgi:hypothetical protein
MAIKTNDAAVSVDFEYEDDKTEEVFKVKLHCTQEYGQTVSISGNVGGFTTGNDAYLALPINLLIEAIDFLRQNKYIESPAAVRTERSPGPSLADSPASPQFARTTVTPTTLLPMPNLGNTQAPPAQPVVKEAAEAPPEIPEFSDELPLQTLSVPVIQEDEPVEEEYEEYSEIDVSHDGEEAEEEYEEVEDEEDGDNDEDIGELTDEEVSEAKRMAKEREQATKRANSKPAPKVRRKKRKQRKPPRKLSE